MKITNEVGLENFKSYLKDLNDLPDDRAMSLDKFTGRKTLRDSFLHVEDENYLLASEQREIFQKYMSKHTEV